jgi:hypothetical protein
MALLDLTGVAEQSSDAANNVKGGTPDQRAFRHPHHEALVTSRPPTEERSQRARYPQGPNARVVGGILNPQSSILNWWEERAAIIRRSGGTR